MAAHTNVQITDIIWQYAWHTLKENISTIKQNYVHRRHKWRPHLIFNSVSWRSYAVLGTLTTVSKHWNGVRMGKTLIGPHYFRDPSAVCYTCKGEGRDMHVHVSLFTVEHAIQYSQKQNWNDNNHNRKVSRQCTDKYLRCKQGTVLNITGSYKYKQC